MNPRSEFDLARRLRKGTGAPLAEIFSFLSGLYFRGKYIYASAFARPPKNQSGVLVITTNRGLLPADTSLTLPELCAFGEVPIDPKDDRYLKPLERDAAAVLKAAGRDCRIIFLGSIGTGKYVDVLLRVFGERLLFPSEFVGRGDMSRGGLLLRAAAAGEELTYVPVSGTKRHGSRPPKLTPRRWGFKVNAGSSDAERALIVGRPLPQ